MPIDGKKNACENKEKYPLSPPIGTVVEFDRQSPRSQGSRREITRGNEAINHVVFGSRGEILANLRQRSVYRLFVIGGVRLDEFEGEEKEMI